MYSTLLGNRPFILNSLQQEKEDEKSIQEIEKTRNFVEKPGEFTEELIDGLIKDLNMKK